MRTRTFVRAEWQRGSPGNRHREGASPGPTYPRREGRRPRFEGAGGGLLFAPRLDGLQRPEGAPRSIPLRPLERPGPGTAAETQAPGCCLTKRGARSASVLGVEHELGGVGHVAPELRILLGSQPRL